MKITQNILGRFWNVAWRREDRKCTLLRSGNHGTLFPELLFFVDFKIEKSFGRTFARGSFQKTFLVGKQRTPHGEASNKVTGFSKVPTR
jgi:hypothetical protein